MESVTASKNRQDVIGRIRRISGQLRGIEKMLVEGRRCEEVLTQMAAVREATNRAGVLLIEGELEHCLLNLKEEERPEALKRAMGTLLKFGG
ncbi:MAG: metal-sensitive transcriptional regulator [Bacillota bacterium]